MNGGIQLRYHKMNFAIKQWIFFQFPLILKIDLSFISATLKGVHLFGGHQIE